MLSLWRLCILYPRSRGGTKFFAVRSMEKRAHAANSITEQQVGSVQRKAYHAQSVTREVRNPANNLQRTHNPPARISPKKRRRILIRAALTPLRPVFPGRPGTSSRLEQVPEELVVNLVMVLHLWRFHERAQRSRATVSRRSLQIRVATFHVGTKKLGGPIGLLRSLPMGMRIMDPRSTAEALS